MKSKKPSAALIIFYLMSFYIIASLCWWTWLMVDNNKYQFEIEKERLLLQYEKQGITITDFESSKAYSGLHSTYVRKRNMILGEAFVFVSLLVLGFFRVRQYFRSEMRLANQQRNFMLSITHELRSPLAALQLSVETLQKRKLNEDQKDEIYQNALKDVDRLNELVENILLAARLESAGHSFLEEDVDLTTMIEGVINDQLSRNPERNIHSNIADRVHLTGDHTAIYSMVSNLVENALKYSDDDIEVVLDTHGGSALFSVKDNGLGIPPAERKMVIKKFYRVGEEETRKTKGTGLGLYIVDQVVRAHGGKLEIRSNEEKGTVFEISLPIDLI